MNSCILMAQIVQDPELRYTADTQVPIAQMLVQFPGLREEDPPTPLKVVGWGNFASEIKENYTAGDRVIIEGRLSMNTITRPEGFKEKRAELTAYRIYKLEGDANFESPVSAPMATAITPESATKKSNNVVVPLRANQPTTSMPESDDFSYEPSIAPSPSSNPEPRKDLDDIPF